MSKRLEIFIKENTKDVVGEKLKQRIETELKIKLNHCHFVEVYNINADLSESEMEKLSKEVFVDPVIQNSTYRSPAFEHLYRVEIGLLPGVTDNIGKTAREAVADCLEREVEIYYSRVYALDGELDEEKCNQIGSLLFNQLIEKCIVYGPLKPEDPYIPKVVLKHEPVVEKISLRINPQRLETLAKQRLLALSLEEFKAIKNYLKDEKVLEERTNFGLDEKITDVELEVIAQTWSEHCKHKIFNAQIDYVEENGESHAINSIFKTFIRGATEMIRKPYVVSVFKDNGGIIKFNHDYDIAIKVETHNAPSALDPYGGALTGVLGVQRDVLGTGLGALPIANMDVLCFGPLGATESEIPRGVLHPKRIYEGVIKGVEHGGNKMGIPNVNGSIFFDRGFVARPLVYCGTVGLMPSMIGEKRTSEKKIEPGYLAVMVGGRIGKDGIHGATFSSQQLDSSVPQSVVQIGDPITQKKMLDFIIDARDKQLYEAITDNGAGGLSSSVGELAQLSGGCEIYLEKAPLKYPGLDPWEILLSESQERMTIAVPLKSFEKLVELAKIYDVEVSAVGKFTNTGKFHVFYKSETVAYLNMDFLHDGVPQMKLEAKWKKKIFSRPQIEETDLGKILKSLLSFPTIASKESVTRQYDHEVKGMSVIKPIMIGPSDAGVIKPLYRSDEGLVIAHGICPKFVHDGYDMAGLAFDEGVRNAIAAGAKFGYLACLDNFSWPDPIKSERTPDGEQKLADLVRACIALYDLSTAYGVPIISGKDSMKNDYYVDGQKYSIPPTLLVTVIGKIDDVKKAVSAEFKKAGDHIYVLGKTYEELGGSEYYRMFNSVGENHPKVRANENIPLYKALSHAIESKLVQSVHDISDGGLGVALVESAFPLNFGIDADLANLPRESENEDVLLFAESAGRFVVSVSEEKVPEFEKIMHGRIFGKIGRVRGDKRVIIRKNQDRIIVNEDIEELKNHWNNPKY